MRAHDAFNRVEEQFNTALDTSLNPAGPTCSTTAWRRWACPPGRCPENTEAAIAGAGLRIDRRVIVGTEWGEYAEEHGTQPGRPPAARGAADP